MRTRPTATLLSVLVAGWVLGSVVPVRAATRDVAIQGFAFTPQTIEVDLGDAVRWTNLDRSAHSTTAPGWDSGALGQGSTFTFTFGSAGTFDYVCSIHPSMRGRVIVAANQEPVAPSAPRQVEAEPGSRIGEIDVSWLPPQSSGGTAITGYLVCRVTDTLECVIETEELTTVTDVNRPLLETSRYVVIALNAVGAGPPSAEACAVPFPWVDALGCR